MWFSIFLLKPYISKELEKKLLAPISYIGLDGESYRGVSASVLPDICDVWITALKSGILNASQTETAEQAYILFKGFATVGITALVDEATGYKKQKQDEYRALFNTFIAEEFREWNKEFPDDFPNMIYRLYGIKRIPNKNQPQFFSWFTKKYIYYPLANSNGAILEKLEEKNPVVYEKGGRRYKLHQFLSDYIGLPAFKAHLWKVIGIGAASKNKTDFDKLFSRAFPSIGHQYDLLDGYEED